MQRTFRREASSAASGHLQNVLVSVGIGLCALLLAVVAYVTFTLRSPEPPSLGLHVSDALAYCAHASLATTLNVIGASPKATAIQWLKAASHARSPGEVDRAGLGLKAAVERSGGNPSLEVTICLVEGEGSPTVDTAVSKAGVQCPLS
jgi:hypothetical protein